MPPEQDILAGFPKAAAWSLWAGQAGKGFVIAGIAFFVLALLACLLQGKYPKLARVANVGMWLGCISVFGSMASLLSLFINNQFQYEYVFGHGDIHTDLKYKIAGVWTGQQGSFLLWATCAALFGLLTVRGTGEYRRWYTFVFAAFLGTVCGILAYETPFKLIADVVRDGVVHVPPTGNGMTPTLQNYWVVIHPPTIFLGFGSLTIFFAYAVAAILTGNLTNWVVYSRPWAMLSLSLLGTGLIMGGLWAYETLNWGGFWKWDPVENTSFVPWIFLAAFIHGIIVQTTKKRWYGFNLWFGALPFMLFVYGTFLTRSGFLTEVSVHSFAQMEKSALYILEIFLGVLVASFTILYFAKGRKLVAVANGPKMVEKGIERESTYTYGMLLLALFGFVIGVGMSWPVILALFGQKSAVIEEPLYHKVVIWFFAPIMLFMAIAPFVAWRSMTAKELLGRTINVFSLSAGLTGFTLLAMKLTIDMPSDLRVAMPGGGSVPAMPWMAFLLFLCMFVAVSSVWRIVEIGKRARMSLGGFVSHLGLATLLAGLVLSRGLESHQRTFMRADEQIKLLDYTITQNGFTGDLRDRNNRMIFALKSPKGDIDARPTVYYYKDGNNEDHAMTWPYIDRHFSHDVYFALHEPIWKVWNQPVWFKVGESQTIDDITVTYKGMTTHGQPGSPDAKFGAHLVVETMGKTYTAEPQFGVSEGSILAQVGPNFKMALTQIDAANKSAALQLLFASPIYPVELFYKPLTILIWIGSGILLLGGLMTAWARRRPKGPRMVGEAETPESANDPEVEPLAEEPRKEAPSLVGSLHAKKAKGSEA